MLERLIDFGKEDTHEITPFMHFQDAGRLEIL
jgi:hypothetical protein